MKQLTKELRDYYLDLLSDGRTGFCKTCNQICFTPEELFEHKSGDHEKTWIYVSKYPCVDD